MAEYDFSTLNGSDLEELVCDLLNYEQPKNSSIRYRTFKEGKDKGIDILYSSFITTYDHIGQVKHFYRTGYKNMIKVLRNEEVKKIQEINPNKLIFATSVDLSIYNYEEIKSIFEPYIKSINDIYGKKDMNRLIEKHENILNNHFKLWFCSTSIIKKIINSDLEYRSSLMNDFEFKKKIRLYVQTPTFNKAKKLLNEEKYLIITGEPGVGKTTLAEMLVYEYIKEDYKISYIIDNITEVERILIPDDSKQIIYFDDFLGSNEIEINKAKGSEAVLSKLIRRIKDHRNKLLIFTTRSHLLNSAIIDSEKLQQLNFKNHVSKLELSEYNLSMKEAIFVNHVEESGLQEEFKLFLKQKKTIDFVIKHQNFSPRLIEYITDSKNINKMDILEYEKFILNNIHISKVWEYAYCFQLNEDDRILLNSLITFGDNVHINLLKGAFDSRMLYEKNHNNKHVTQFAFTNSLKKLNEGFIIIKDGGKKVQFINPSFIDFLLNFLRNEPDEIIIILKSIYNIKQLTTRLFNYSTSFYKEIPQFLKSRILTEYHSLVSETDKDIDLFQIALVLYKYIDFKESETVICKILDEIEDWGFLNKNLNLNIYFINFLEKTKHTKIYTKLNYGSIINILLNSIYNINDAINLLKNLDRGNDVKTMKKYDFEIKTKLEHILENTVDDRIDFLKYNILTLEQLYQEKNIIKDYINTINELGIEINDDCMLEFDYYEWYQYIDDHKIDNELNDQITNEYEKLL